MDNNSSSRHNHALLQEKTVVIIPLLHPAPSHLVKANILHLLRSMTQEHRRPTRLLGSGQANNLVLTLLPRITTQ